VLLLNVKNFVQLKWYAYYLRNSAVSQKIENGLDIVCHPDFSLTPVHVPHQLINFHPKPWKYKEIDVQNGRKEAENILKHSKPCFF